jgi:hypothetical protein
MNSKTGTRGKVSRVSHNGQENAAPANVPKANEARAICHGRDTPGF